MQNILFVIIFYVFHYISVCITLGYGLDDRGSRVRFPTGLGTFPFTTESRTSLGPTPLPIQWVPGALTLRLKRPGREDDQSPPSNAEVKECVELYFHLPIRLHGVMASALLHIKSVVGCHVALQVTRR
jgi:hypothetical protein